MTHETFAGTLALIGVVILISSLLSGMVERTGLPQVAIFLLVGAVLGPAGLGLVELSLEPPALQVIVTVGLLLVLFSDAIGVDVGEVRQQRRLALLILGPGTLLPAALITVAGRYLLALSWPAAAILGAALASTDPVLLRTLVRHSSVPPAARLGLRLESGMNDVILLPIVVLGMLALRASGPAPAWEVASRAVGLFLLGPMLGAFAGWAGITLLDQVRRRMGVRRDYESLYALGVAFTAFAAAEAMGGSGFLAAFAAGLVIAALDVELCDCFLDYGEASAEMFLLLTFVAFGAGLIWTGLQVAGLRSLLFALVALGVRTAVLSLVLVRAPIDRHSRRLIAWFGPRGLSSLLLVLLPVFAEVPGAEHLFALACLVVLLSVLLHGGGIALWLRAAGREAPESERRNGGTAEGSPEVQRREPADGPAPGAPSTVPPIRRFADPPERMTIAELRELQQRGDPVTLLDVRTERSYRDDPRRAAAALRFPPDDAVRLARERALDRHGTLVLYCT